MRCRQCGADNEEDYKFCGACGTPLFVPATLGKSNTSDGQTNPKCPYCATVLEVAPKRKKPCPQCGEPIYVRKGRLLTEEDANIEDWLNRLGYLNLTRNDFDLHREALSKQFGRKATINDTIWRILNLRIKGDDLNVAGFCYREMARIVGQEGKDPKPYLAESLRTQLYELKRQGVKTVTVLGCNDDSGCRKCKSLEGKKFSIEVAIEKLPIPNLCRDEGGCRCQYIPAKRADGLLDFDYGVLLNSA